MNVSGDIALFLKQEVCIDIPIIIQSLRHVSTEFESPSSLFLEDYRRLDPTVFLQGIQDTVFVFYM